MAISSSGMHILSALASERLYGYAIIERVSNLSDGEVRLTAGTLYGALDRYVSAGWVVPDGEEIVGGRARRWYRLTEAGAEALRAEAVRMRRTSEIAQRHLRAREAHA